MYSSRDSTSLIRSILVMLVFCMVAPMIWAQQAWPSRPIKVVVSFPPGGVGDIMARLVSQQLSEAMGQPFAIDNRGGGGGNVGSAFVAKSQPDGYTFVVTATSVESINPLIYASMPFNPAKELTPVSMLGGVKLFLVVKPGMPVNDTKELVNLAKANPGKMSFGSASTGSMTHLAAELFTQQAGITATHIPYRGAAPALQDLLGGQIDYLLDPGIAFSHVRAGKLKMLAVASMTRSTLFPQVPTLHELGYRDVNGDTVFGLYAPAGTPPQIISRLNQEVNKILASPSLKAKFMEFGGEPMIMTPAEVTAWSKAEANLFGDIIKSRGIKAE